ncbi:hypothetical protein DB346_13055 [Verrucomicrobia bacterium LW23]|nr:hypothetical protein DB346_13055 [Verrucomicrobia bacterium LW23]
MHARPAPEAAAPRRFRYWLDPLCWGGALLYLANRLIIKPFLLPHSSLIQGHFNDFLLVPVALPVFLYVYRILGLRRHNRPPDAREIAIHVVAWSIFFEVYSPLVFPRSVGDPWDAIAYAAGGLLAWSIWNGNFPLRIIRFSTSNAPSAQTARAAD